MYQGTYMRLDLNIHDSPRTVIRRSAQLILKPLRFDRSWRRQRKEFYRIMLLNHEKAKRLAANHRL